jgi:hypothetical protein
MSASRVSMNDVRGMFLRAVRAANTLGMDTTGWTVSEGSKINGVSYKLDMSPSIGIGYGANFLGFTAREAHTALEHIARAWEVVAEIRDHRA